MLTIAEFRRRVKATYPHVTVSVRTVDFTDLARTQAKCLTVTRDRQGDLVQINAWARETGIVPDGSLRYFPG
jgi:hypothetical protein